MTKHFRTLSLCVVLMLIPSLALSQSTNATITGQVADPTKAVLPQATVRAINNNTNVRYEGQTNQSGMYVISSLPPGDYRVEVEKPGFKTIVKPDIVLHVQDTIELNFEMALGSASETLTVTGGAPLVNTQDASVSTVVDQTYVRNMPLNGRSFQNLILLTPGVLTQTPQGNPGGEFSVNGQRTSSNYFTVDGVSANVGVAPGIDQISLESGISGSAPAATALGTTQALVSVDALQEFRVQTSTYSAEYGRNPGGQFAFETKSGTNQWHGTAYDYLRNGAFDAQDWFNHYFGVKQAAIYQNDFGATLGGPLEIPGVYNGKDRTFFFGSFEGLRLSSPQAASVNFVPDSAIRASAPSAVQQALNAYPVPNGPNVRPGVAQFIGSWSNPGSINSTSVRFDHVVNDKMRLFFRFSDITSSSASRGTSATRLAPTVITTVANAFRSYTVGNTNVFATRLANQIHLNYTSNEATLSQVMDAFGGATPVDLARLSGLGSGSWLSFDGVGTLFINLAQQQAAGTQKQWNFVDKVDLSLGRHQFKFGADYRRLAPSATIPTPFVGYAYFSQSAIMANNASAAVIARASAHPLYQNFSVFAEDEWKASERLNLSLGLRWEVNPPPGVTEGLMPYTIQGTGPSNWAVAPQGTPLWRTTWYNIAPRLGAAYILRSTPGRETVVRAGGGVFFDTGQNLGSIGFQGPGFNARNTFSAPFPVNAVTRIPEITNPPVSRYSTPVYGFAPRLQLPYTLQWNAALEQSFGASQVFTLSYVGSHGARLLQFKTFQPSGNPNATQFNFVENGLTSDYSSLQAQFRRSLSQGLTALASYTWSHCIDYASGDYRFGYQRGDCDFDVRHSVSSALSYDLPTVGHGGFANAVLHHWGVDARLTARTAFPVTLYGTYLVQPDFQAFYGGLDSVPGQPVYLYGANCASVLQGLGSLQPGQSCPGNRAINPKAFTASSSGPGNVPRNFARGFGTWQMDLAVRRDFPIRESLRLQVRAVVFNLFNHLNLGKINDQFGQSTFGQAVGTLANAHSVYGLSPLYQTGGARSIQFALKLIF